MANKKKGLSDNGPSFSESGMKERSWIRVVQRLSSQAPWMEHGIILKEVKQLQQYFIKSSQVPRGGEGGIKEMVGKGLGDHLEPWSEGLDGVDGKEVQGQRNVAI